MVQIRSVATVASGFLVVGLTACGGGAAPPVAPPASSAPASSAPAPSAPASSEVPSTTPSATSASPSASSSSAPGVPADKSQVTPDGTKLKVGETATGVYESSKKETVVSIKAVTIEKGSKDDLKNFKVEDAALKQATPYYVTMEYAYVNGEPIKSPYLNVKLRGADASGASLSHVLLMGKFDKCNDKKAKELGPGAKQTECRVFMAPPGSELTQVAWVGSYKGKGIVWTS